MASLYVLSANRCWYRFFCLGLVLVLSPVGSIVAVASDVTSGTKITPGAGILTLKSMEATLERPLFTPGRRPPERPPAQINVSVPAPQPPDVVLAGIVVGPSSKFAVLSAGTGDDTQTLHIGDDVEGWTVLDITSKTVVIGLGKQHHTIVLNSERVDPTPDNTDKDVTNQEDGS